MTVECIPNKTKTPKVGERQGKYSERKATLSKGLANVCLGVPREQEHDEVKPERASDQKVEGGPTCLGNTHTHTHTHTHTYIHTRTQTGRQTCTHLVVRARSLPTFKLVMVPVCPVFLQKYSAAAGVVGNNVRHIHIVQYARAVCACVYACGSRP